MDTPSDEKRKIHPSEYKLPKVCQKARLYTRLITFGIIMFSVLCLVFIVHDWFIDQRQTALPVILWLAGLWPLIVQIYLEPNLMLTDKALVVKFPFQQYVIPWDEVLEVKREKVSTWIFVQDLTLLHRLFGLVKLRLSPGFVISHAFPDQYEILKLIEYKIAIES